jgi:hypothetical protein
MVTFQESVSVEDEIDSSSDFENLPSSAEIYQKPIPKKQTWNKYITTVDTDGSASEKHTDFNRKAEIGLKIITVFITFCVVLITGVVSKVSLLLIIAQVT